MARLGGLPLPTITDDRALGGSAIERSLRFTDGDTTYLNRTPSSDGNRKTFTISFWVKRSKLGDVRLITCHSGNSDTGNFELDFVSDAFRYLAWSTAFRTTSRLFRDTSAWYHIVTAIDTTDSTADDRIKIYVNGVQETSFSSSTNPSQNSDTGFNQASTTRIGLASNGTSGPFGGYMTEINFIDGIALDASYFGFTDSQTGIWMPKRYEGAYGTNGFYLDLSDDTNTTTLGIDKSPNGNDFTLNNFATTDSVIDTPTNNFCTHNFLDDDYTSKSAFSEGNLKIVRTGNNHGSTRGTMGMSSGKWYYEYCYTTTTNSGAAPWVGVCNSTADITDFRTAGMWNYGSSSGKYLVRDNSSYDYGSSISGGTVIGVAIDMDNKKIWIADSNTWFGSSNNDTDGNPSTGANPTDTFTDSDIPDGKLYPQMGSYTYDAIKANFGQDSSFSEQKQHKIIQIVMELEIFSMHRLLDF